MHYFLFEDSKDLFSFHLAIMEKSSIREPLNLVTLILKNLSQKNPAKLSQDSLACRALLSDLLARLKIDRATLDDSLFPYKLVAYNGKEMGKYVVSFSHSRERSAVLLVKSSNTDGLKSGTDLSMNLGMNLGIDIEDNAISHAVAQRFFHAEELAWLQTLQMEQQALARKLLWTLKESFIKAQADKTSQLIKGLQFNVLIPISPLELENLLTVNMINICEKQDSVFGFIPTLQCGFVLMKNGMK